MLFRVRREILQRDLARFVREAWPLVEGDRELKWNWHMDAVCQHLQALDDGTLPKRKLIFNVPPRTSKSTLVTVMFPIWVWTRRPWVQFMFASYSFSLSRDHAYKRRQVLDSKWFQERWGEKVAASTDRNNVVEISNTAKGLMYTTSVGGSTTGRGGDYLLLDDPNSAEEMESEVQRASCLRFVDVAWSTRANDAKTVREVVIQQRTHEDDVTGHLLKQQPDEWLHVKIPMEYNPDSTGRSTSIWSDPRKVKGEIIDPIRFPTKYIETQKIRLGTYRYAGQYDQEPAPLGGGIIKASWLRPWYHNADKDIVLPGLINGGDYKFNPWNVTRFATVDLAFTEEEIGEKKLDDPDFTVMAAWAAFKLKRGTVLVLLDLIRERMEGPDMLLKLEAFHTHWRFAVIGFETIQAQKALFQFARKMGLPVREISTKNDEEALYRLDKDKVSRVVAATPLMEAGGFYVPTYAPWLLDYTQELTRFPNASHDDQCDVTSCAVPIADKVASILEPDRGERPAERPKREAPISTRSFGPTDWRKEFPGGVIPQGEVHPTPETFINNFGADGT